MTNQLGCNKCIYRIEAQCSRLQKVVGQKLNVYEGSYYPEFNIPTYKLPYCSAERENRGIIKSFIFGKTCGETAQFFKSR